MLILCLLPTKGLLTNDLKHFMIMRGNEGDKSSQKASLRQLQKKINLISRRVRCSFIVDSSNNCLLSFDGFSLAESPPRDLQNNCLQINSTNKCFTANNILLMCN